MTDEEAAMRGRAAEREWAELDAAFSVVRESIMAEMISTSVVNTDKILRLHAAVQSLTAVRQAILNVVQNGQVAQHALNGTDLLRAH